MDLGIRNRTALVTASSGGMGRNTAYALAAEGANVVLFARTAEKLQSAAAEIEAQHGVKALAVPGSMLVVDDIARLASEIQRVFGGLDIAVLISGRPPNPLRATLDETEAGRWHEAYHNQLWSVIQMVCGTLPLMQGRGWGRIIAVTSASVKAPMPHHALSTVFRAGVTAYMKHLANELGGDGITVNCVAPALIDTSHRTGLSAYTAAQSEARRKLSPLGRMGTQQEVTGLITFLASMQAGFVSGATVPIDGGMTSSLL